MNVLVIYPLDEEKKNKLYALGKHIQYTFATKETLTQAMIDRAEVILGNPDLSMMHKPSNLKMLCLDSAGSDTYVPVIHEDTILTNASGAFGLGISEYIISYLLFYYKKMNLYYENKKQHLWQKEGMVRSLYGKKVLLIGVGDIGSETAKRLHAFGTYNIGIRRTMKQYDTALFDEMDCIDQIDEYLPSADIVVLSLPQTEETNHIMNKERLYRMKKDAFLINVGRGNVLDLNELYEVMHKNHLYAAAIDVSKIEPLDENHPIWTLENVLITPHISGSMNLTYAYETAFTIMYNNLKAYLKKEALQNVVDKQLKY